MKSTDGADFKDEGQRGQEIEQGKNAEAFRWHNPPTAPHALSLPICQIC
jgi:hypothetical protein